MHITNQLRNFIKYMSQRDINQHIQRAKKYDRQAKGFKCNPSLVSVQVLGSGMFGAPSCVYVSTDHSKYLFNCGEGTQRLAQEHHLRLTKLENVFFTTPTWKNMGGLPGMALTIQDIGVPDINLHGPNGIHGIFDAVKQFVLLENLVVTEVNCSDNNYYVDSCMTVKYVHLKKSTPDIESDTDDDLIIDYTNYYAHEVNSNGKRNAKSQKKSNKIPENIVNRIKRGKIRGCIVYICKLHEKAGSLNLEKCVERGVTPGPILGKLKSGEDVTLDDGTTVKSVDVCDPPTPGPVFIVIECPDEDYLDSLLENETFNNYQKDASDPENVTKFIIHFSPESVIRNAHYIEWISRFGNDTQHLIINEKNNCMNFESMHKLQHQLNLLHPTIFPIIHDQQDIESIEDPIEGNSLMKSNIHRANALDVIHLRPMVGFCRSTGMSIDKQANLDQLNSIEGFSDSLLELQEQINSRSKYISESPTYPKIIMLGTGSCIPNKVRNTSGILMRIDEDTSVLLDCGEGTAGQLIRFFGPSEIGKILASIKGIYVSHLHADHHLGLLGVLQARKRFIDEPIFLLAPKQIESWLHLFNTKFESIANSYTLIPNKCLHYINRKITDDAYNELKKKLRVDNVSTVEVHHCPHSFAVAWNLKCGKKIVYSGDTRPCTNIVLIGNYCDLLIHEATMEDGLDDEAKKKMHSTVSEALTIGEKMNAKFILLTHFSQRYSKMPRLPDTRENFDNIGIAFDNMQFSIAELSLLPLFYPSLKLMFGEYFNILEEKAQKRIKSNKRKYNLANT